MSIRYAPRTDLFKSGADILVNPVNTVGVLGAGLARAFRSRWPKYAAAYYTLCARGELPAGGAALYHTAHPPPAIIASAATKAHWRNPSTLGLVEGAAEALADLVSPLDAQSIAVPKLGCGLGGLDWRDVHAVITPALERIAASGTHVIVLGERPA